MTDTVPSLPGLSMLMIPPQSHMQVHCECSAGWPCTVTLVAPGVQGELVAGMHGAGVRTPIAADVAAATAGLSGAMHMPKLGMLSTGTKLSMVAASVVQVTGVPTGVTFSGGVVGGLAIEQLIIASLDTSGGICRTVRPPRPVGNRPLLDG